MTTIHIVLIGDSIFDNEPYVETGFTVSEQLSGLAVNAETTLLAVDGDVTTDVDIQLRKMPSTATHVFISCGGNDALNSLPVLHEEISTVGEALDILHKVTETFRYNYREMLSSILSKTSNPTVCTIYNCVPGLPAGETAALSIFNEIILEEAIRKNLPIMDLRILCNSKEDYSEISPIEPSEEGGRKIAELIWDIANGHRTNNGVAVHF